jgi:peptidoglycan-associated lipoprotein
MKPRVVRASTAAIAFLAAVTLAACAKRPATTAVGAPASPTGAVDRVQEPGPGAPGGQAAAERPGAQPPAPDAPPAVTPVEPPAVVAAPPATRRPPLEFQPVEALKDIHFDFDKYDIRRADEKILDENARWMKVNTHYLILIEGHADERGTNEYNLVLGERRDKSALNYLVAKGVEASRLTLISYGEQRPLCTE